MKVEHYGIDASLRQMSTQIKWSRKLSGAKQEKQILGKKAKVRCLNVQKEGR